MRKGRRARPGEWLCAETEWTATPCCRCRGMFSPDIDVLPWTPYLLSPYLLSPLLQLLRCRCASLNPLPPLPSPTAAPYLRRPMFVCLGRGPSEPIPIHQRRLTPAWFKTRHNNNPGCMRFCSAAFPSPSTLCVMCWPHSSKWITTVYSLNKSQFQNSTEWDIVQ